MSKTTEFWKLMAYIYSKQSYFKNSASECGDSHNLFPVEKINVKFIH